MVKSVTEALLLESVNPQYDNRLFIGLQPLTQKNTSSEHVMYRNCFCFGIQNNSYTQHVLSLYFSG